MFSSCFCQSIQSCLVVGYLKFDKCLVLVFLIVDKN